MLTQSIFDFKKYFKLSTRLIKFIIIEFTISYLTHPIFLHKFVNIFSFLFQKVGLG